MLTQAKTIRQRIEELEKASVDVPVDLLSQIDFKGNRLTELKQIKLFKARSD